MHNFFLKWLFLIVLFSATFQNVRAAVPVISNASPTGVLAADITDITISVQTDIAATCRYTYTLATAYDDPNFSHAFSVTGDIAHSNSFSFLPGTTTGQTFHYYIYCIDEGGEVNQTPYDLTFSVGASNPPTLSSATQDELTSNTASLELFSSEFVSCRYSTSAGIEYDLMTEAFEDSGTYHYKRLTGLSPSTTYNFYVRCAYPTGTPNTSDFLISFTTLDSSDTLAPSTPMSLSVQ